jgi:hypothetical protein
MMRRALILVLIGCLGGVPILSGCFLRSADELVQGADLVVEITGLEEGDLVALELEGRAWQSRAESGKTMNFFLSVEPGPFTLSAKHQRGTSERCLDFSGRQKPDEQSRIGLDLAFFGSCPENGLGDAGPPIEADGGGEIDGGAGLDGGIQDAGDEPEEDGGEDDPQDGGEDEPAQDTFIEFTERVTDLTCGGACDEVETRVDAEGRIRFRGATEWEGNLSESDLQGFVADLHADESQVLFAGMDPECPLASPPADISIQWELKEESMSEEGMDGGEAEDGISVDVSGCTAAAVVQISARLDFLRARYRPALDGGN